MAKLTPTFHHLHQNGNFVDGERAVPSWALHHPTFVPRLTFKGFAKVRASTTPFTSLSWADVVYYCDSSLLDVHVAPELWDAMLDGPGRIVLIDRVVTEARAWMLNHRSHPLVRAVAQRHPRIIVRGSDDLDEIGRTTFDYYVALLAVRRTPMLAAQARFRREQGRLPSAEEEQHLHADIQRELGARGAQLARKRGRSGLFTDEAVVYLAVEEALRTGRQVVILTQDSDLQEQFFKLLWFIDTQYRGMLLADWYLENFGAFKLHAIPSNLAHLRIFKSEQGVLFERSSDLLDQVLPSRFRFVAISCLTVGAYVSQLTFGAEQEMAEVLAVKGRTGGLSTSKLAGRNIHPWLAPLPIEQSLHGCAAVVHDVRLAIPRSKATLSRLDIGQSLASVERHAKLVEAESRDQLEAGLPTSRSIFRHLPGARPTSRPPIPGPGGILLPFDTPRTSLDRIGTRPRTSS